MSTPYLGQILMSGFNFAPKGYALCEGQLLPINQNQALFSILGTTYGGNGTTNFALPDLRGSTPIHAGDTPGGSTRRLGERGGEVNHTLALGELPSHSHSFNTSGTAATLQRADNSIPSVVAAGTVNMFAASGTPQVMAPGMISSVGGGQPHNNMQPSLVIYFSIALQGIFPPRN